jgi:hypothetical protein
MFLVAHGLDLDDSSLILDQDVIEDAEVAEAQLPVGQLILAQSLAVPSLDGRLVSQLLTDGVEDDLLLVFPIGSHMFGGDPRECDLKIS